MLFVLMQLLSLLFLPAAVCLGHALGAGTVACRDGGLLVGEEDPVGDVLALGDVPQGGGAVQPAVDFQLPMAAQSAGGFRVVGLAVFSNEVIHRSYTPSPDFAFMIPTGDGFVKEI